MPAPRIAWRRRPNRLLALFVGVTLLPATGLLWLGWSLSHQDQQLAQKQLEDRLDNVAETIAADAARDVDALDPVTFTPPSASGAIAVVLTPAGVTRRAGAPLLFHPVVSRTAEPPPDTWFDAQRAEDRGETAAAIARFERLARSSDASIRAGAMMRLARVLRKAGRSAEALEIYGQMAGMDDVTVFEEPASLQAALGRLKELSDRGRSGDHDQLATAIRQDLAGGRWTIDRTMFEYAWQQLGLPAGAADEVAESLALTVGIDTVWHDWRSRRSDGQPWVGRKVIWDRDTPVVVSWHDAGPTLAILAAAPRFFLDRWHSSWQAAGVTVTAVDALRGPIFSTGALSEPTAVRSQDQSGLPWTFRVSSAAPEQELAAFARGRRQLWILPLAAFLVVAAAYFIARGVRRELAVAELQSNFVSAVSHEFRTPLTSMTHLVELLRDRPDMDAARRNRYYDTIQQEADRLRRFVDQLLDFGRVDAGAARYRLEPADVNTLVARIVDQFRGGLAGRDRVVEFTPSGLAATAEVDDESFTLALMNLLENAAKYSAAPRPIRVSLDADGPSRQVRVHVRDEGPGIPRAEQAAIFEKFVRGSEAQRSGIRGTGVGLALAREIIRGHGGDIQVESDTGRGSTFTIVLPSATALVEATERHGALAETHD